VRLAEHDFSQRPPYINAEEHALRKELGSSSSGSIVRALLQMRGRYAVERL
jgi:hypothetical protein